MNILIIKCGNTYPEIIKRFGNFDDLIIKHSLLPAHTFSIYNIYKGEKLPHPVEFAAAVITGSHYNINQRFDWIKQLQDWVTTARYAHLPLLGICFGHQIIAKALGGTVQKNENGPNIGKATILPDKEQPENPLFKGTGNEFESFVSHGWTVKTPGPGTNVIARDLKGNIMALQSDNIIGIQFHPEFTESIVKIYLKEAKLPASRLLGVKLRSEYKNQSILPNFFSHIVNF
ncbi:MAG: gamma-glutamyl-gamma-aminobutyrate hydrolase family protein [Prolixibacteraceae bacterium]|nr:gamma-glutamyl-gamma-aminobutyrate hydrolase family protein [Prolixibacteraceae bacterium]